MKDSSVSHSKPLYIVECW